MISSGAVVISRANDKTRNLTIDYFLYISLCSLCVCLIIVMSVPLFVGYTAIDFLGLT